jgi:hypothetical protein
MEKKYFACSFKSCVDDLIGKKIGSEYNNINDVYSNTNWKKLEKNGYLMCIISIIDDSCIIERHISRKYKAPYEMVDYSVFFKDNLVEKVILTD